MIYRSSHQRCSIKKVVLRISQNSQENTVPESAKFAKFLRAPFLPNTSGRLLLDLNNDNIDNTNTKFEEHPGKVQMKESNKIFTF